MPADANLPASRVKSTVRDSGQTSLGDASVGLKTGARLDKPHLSGGAQDLTAADPIAKSRASDLWALAGCNAIVFCASVCIMVLELTASRLIASYVGNSLSTWTSVIGVVLAGISIGNYLGGWLADRFPPQKALAWLFLAAARLPGARPTRQAQFKTSVRWLPSWNWPAALC